MALTMDTSSDNINIRISGRFDFQLHKDFRQAIDQSAERLRHCHIDLSETEYMDSAALGMLLLLRERAGGDEAQIRISGASPEVKTILSTANFQQLFRIE